MLTTSPSITTISAALLSFQGRVEGVGKNAKNPAFKSRYANLEAVVDTARPELQAVGIVFLQIPGAIVENVMSMTTRLIHAESGEWIEGTGDIPLGKRDPQGAGSAQTYAQRYHLMAMLGLPPVDDDGEGAMDRNGHGHEAPLPSSARTQFEGAGPPTYPKAKAREVYAEMSKELSEQPTVEALERLWRSQAFSTEYRRLPSDWQGMLVADATDRKRNLSGTPANLGEHLDAIEQGVVT